MLINNDSLAVGLTVLVNNPQARNCRLSPEEPIDELGKIEKDQLARLHEEIQFRGALRGSDRPAPDAVYSPGTPIGVVEFARAETPHGHTIGAARDRRRFWSLDDLHSVLFR